MAAPPSRRLLNVDDIPGAPGWLERLVSPLNMFMKATSSALDRGLNYRENFAGEVKVIPFTQPDDWVALSLKAGWTASASDPPMVHKGLDGLVETRGVASGSGAFSVVFDLPSQYHPAVGARFAAVDDSGPVVMQVDANGAMYSRTGTGANLRFYGPRFYASDRTPPRWGTPIDVRLGSPDRPFPGRPGQVNALMCRQQGGIQSSPVQWVDWEPAQLDKGTSGIRIWRVWGPVPNVAYSLTLLVTPE